MFIQGSFVTIRARHDMLADKSHYQAAGCDFGSSRCTDTLCPGKRMQKWQPNGFSTTAPPSRSPDPDPDFGANEFVVRRYSIECTMRKHQLALCVCVVCTCMCKVSLINTSRRNTPDHSGTGRIVEKRVSHRS